MTTTFPTHPEHYSDVTQADQDRLRAFLDQATPSDFRFLANFVFGYQPDAVLSFLDRFEGVR